MSLFFALFLGLVQGITEFLPVSSSGHLSIFQNIFKMENIEHEHLLFDVLLHFGTLISVCIAYRSELLGIIRALTTSFNKEEKAAGKLKDNESRSPLRLLFMLIVATLPLVIIIFLKSYIEILYSNTTFIGFALVITGGLLYISDKIVAGRKNEKNTTITDSIVIGIMQAIAVIPGISRSGSTITGGLFRGFGREYAVKFSFLLSIPAIIGANLISLIDALKNGTDMSLMPIYLVGVIAAMVSGFFAIKLIKYIAKKGKFSGFAYYCWVVGIVVIIVSIFI